MLSCFLHPTTGSAFFPIARRFQLVHEDSAMEFYNVLIDTASLKALSSSALMDLSFKNENKIVSAEVKLVECVDPKFARCYVWEIDKGPRDLSEYNQQKEAIKKQSTLPASMLQEFPKPVIEFKSRDI